jgi:hypothetical protein
MNKKSGFEIALEEESMRIALRRPPLLTCDDLVNPDIDPSRVALEIMQLQHNHKVTDKQLESIRATLRESYESRTKIQQIIAAIESYYAALDRRENGNVAQDNAFARIQNILGMQWK